MRRKQTFPLYRVVTAWLLAVLLQTFPFSAYSYQNDPDGFRTLKWQTARNDLNGLQIHEKHGGYTQYIKRNDELDFDGTAATQIIYGFVEDRLENVTVQFEPADNARYAAVRSKLIAKYGEGETIGEKDLIWRGGKTNIKLGVYGSGFEVIYSDNTTFARRSTKISEFNARFNDKWQELLDAYDAKTSAAKIRQWLAQEGKDILDSYEVTPTGDQVSLRFKGAGTYVFSPSPRNTDQAGSADVYGVEQALAALHSSPDKLKGKDILLRAVIADGVMGFGCDDYLMLVDAKFAGLYERRYAQDLNAAEKEALKCIPIIKSGPSLNMPKGVAAAKGETVFRGHFFDNGLKPCEDGWKRFVVIGTE